MIQLIQTEEAPLAIGAYSPAVKVGTHVYISGQIPLNPETMVLITDDIDAEIKQIFNNLKAIAVAAGGNLSNFVKLTVYLTDLMHFTRINEIMTEYFTEPYPARTLVQVTALPKGARVEVDAVMVL
jgi:reactive intermediate/imine deaminase